MKEGWIYTTIGESCDINYGTRVVRARDGGSIYDVYGGGGATFKMNSYNRENCVVVARFAMSKQCTRYVSGKFFLNDSGLTVSPKKGSQLSQVLLDKLLIALNDTIYNYGRGSAQRNLNTKEFSQMSFAYPRNLSEQERIVAFLDTEFEKIDQLKANAAAQLQAAKDLFQAALKEMLTPKEGWTEKKIGDACEIIGGSTPKTKDPSNWDGDYYWVTPAELTGSKYYGVTKRTITQKGAAGLRLLPIGTVLLSSRAPIGKVAITTVPMYCNQGFKNIICPNGIYNEYVYWYILYSVPQLEELGEGTTFKELSKGRLSKFILPIPPLPEQQRIAERLDAISEKVKALQSNYDQTLTLCNDLKQALLKSIFA